MFHLVLEVVSSGFEVVSSGFGWFGSGFIWFDVVSSGFGSGFIWFGGRWQLRMRSVWCAKGPLNAKLLFYHCDCSGRFVHPVPALFANARAGDKPWEKQSETIVDFILVPFGGPFSLAQ